METLLNQFYGFIKSVKDIDPFLWALIVLGFSFIFGLIFRALFYRFIRLYTRRKDWKMGASILTHLGNRTRLFFPLLVFWLLQPIVLLPEPFDDIVQKTTQALFFISVGWILLKSVNVLEDMAYVYYQEERGDQLRERKVRTQLQFLKRIMGVIIFILVLASVLLTFDEVREVGATLLTSAGVAGIIIGVAAQKSLANLLAGLQIAITQPIKIDDAVIVEGEWGNIEEITLTYVVVRIWDKRRIVLPITYFIEKPFQNWTRSSSELTGAIMLYVDYSLPVESLREQLSIILSEEPLWDKQVNVIQVVDTTERTMVLRVLVSSNDASNTWTLRCSVREKLINYIRENHPDALPKSRLTFLDEPPADMETKTLPS
uniref:Mechanosensitive ion channel n=1 Tax=Roseihalotalea indica TaxID=2867963 RepID=A0AA49GME6_9BACT|nr:mechanosensitive ion channel [Tunicatimonas sp. TK19036]